MCNKAFGEHTLNNYLRKHVQYKSVYRNYKIDIFFSMDSYFFTKKKKKDGIWKSFINFSDFIEVCFRAHIIKTFIKALRRRVLLKFSNSPDIHKYDFHFSEKIILKSFEVNVFSPQPEETES